MNENDRTTIKHGESKVFSTKSAFIKNESGDPINILIETSAGDVIDLLLTTGSQFRLIPVGQAAINLLGSGDNAIVDHLNEDHH